MAPVHAARLKDGGLRHFDELIHDQSKEWLIENFKSGAVGYPVNVSRLMRNIVWQLRERVMSGTRDPLHELVRTFWYMYIKPTLARASALSTESDQYAQLVDNMVALVKELDVMRYMQGLLVENISTGETILPMNVVIQTYKNEKDTESGYLAPLMHMPSSDPWNGLRQPVARFLPSALTAYQDPLNGLWRINQDPMRFFRRAGAAF
jgi:hypothetical protein